MLIEWIVPQVQIGRKRDLNAINLSVGVIAEHIYRNYMPVHELEVIDSVRLVALQIQIEIDGIKPRTQVELAYVEDVNSHMYLIRAF
ncbi:Uncharacterised protein [uncultured archaeon]|nr:Uncharacterised protein [uncultured archaeon]